MSSTPVSPVENALQSPLSLCLFLTEAIAAQLSFLLNGDRYRLTSIDSLDELTTFIDDNREHIDCLIMAYDSEVLPFFNQLYEQGCLLPVIILKPKENQPSETKAVNEQPTTIYHNAEVILTEAEWHTLPTVIDKAIAYYLHLSPSCALPQSDRGSDKPIKNDSQQSFLLLQQRRLADKLKERLGYLGVYYKRNPKDFYRNLEREEKREFLDELSLEYREIILTYFDQDSDLNQTIDQFVNRSFFADISVSQILEIHMELMDEFSQKLKLEGRSEEILLDYRLVLIDILAHLGEMYRRSIPREDMPFDLYYQAN
ncbi:MAG: circadian clock protein KaiA [Microcystaceae cyanobacterium]